MPDGLDPRMSADELRATWQYRVLDRAHGKLKAVVLSVLADNFEDAIPVLMNIMFGPGPYDPPFICSSAKIEYNGSIYADYVDAMGRKWRGPFFVDEQDCQDTFRRLADRVKLTDNERVALFAAIQKWIVADKRLDPHLDRNDPDARRATVN